MRNLFTSRARKGAIATILGVCAFTALAAAPGASATVVYDNVPNPLPGNVVSQAFEATSTVRVRRPGRLRRHGRGTTRSSR